MVEVMGSGSVPPIPAKHTSADGTATFDNLSKKKTPRLLFAVSAGARSTTVMVNLNQECHGTYRAILPDRVPSGPAER